MKALLVVLAAAFVATVLCVPLFATPANELGLMLLTIVASGALAVVTVGALVVLERRRRRGENVRALLLGFAALAACEGVVVVFGALQDGFGVAH